MAKKDEEAVESQAASVQSPPPKVELIRVKSNLKSKPDGGSPVAFWERDSRHPVGEAFVSGAAVVEVARTSAVSKALADGRLVEV